MNEIIEVNTINNKTNDLTTRENAFPAPSQREGVKLSEASPYTVTVGDTTVRLNFTGKSDLTARLANAFNTMLG